MGLLFESGDIDILEPVLEEKCEYKLETEVYLPEYLPDIQKLLRCEIIPRVASRDMLAGRITVEGEAEIRIFYKSSEEKISCAVTTKEFSHTVAVSEPDADYDVSTNTVGAINSARASGPRKIAVKAEIVTMIVAARNSTVQIVESVSDGIEAKHETVSAISNAESAEREMRVTEELELPETMPEVAQFLYADAYVKIHEVTPSKGRAVLKGELTVKPVYLSESGLLEKAEFRFPVSQIFDKPNLDEDYICDGVFEVVSIYCEPESSDGKGRILDCELVINALLHAYKISEYGVVTDVYSPCSELSEGYIETKYLTCYDFYRDAKESKGQIVTENTVSKVTDIDAEPRIMRVSADDGCLKAEGTVNVDLVYNDENDSIFSKKSEIPFEFSFPHNCKYELRCDTNVSLDSVGYNISGDNTVDVRCGIEIRAAVCAERKLCAVSDITVIGEKQTCGRTPLVLYFAEEGESAWEIAKRYGASVSEIISENSLEDDAISEARMLLVPLKH